MVSKRLKIVASVFVVIAFAVLLTTALIWTYYLGYMHGRIIEVNSEYRFQRDCVQSVLEDYKEFNGLTLRRMGGTPLIVGELDLQQLTALQDRLSNEFGNDWAELVTQEISVK